MKKLLALFMFALVVTLGFATQDIQADDEVVLYPYDQEACLNAAPECTRTKVGDSHWDVTYNGHIYNVVGGNARYAADFDDANSNGMYDATEIPGNGWASFGGIIVNDTDEEVIIETANQRTDLTGAVHRIYTYFDENGKLAMFEDHWVTKYYIYNDGDEVAPDWRLATQAEIDAYEAEVTATTIEDGDPSSDGKTLKNQKIRIKTDDVDTDGYVLEVLKGLAWTADGANTDVTPTDWTADDWSTVLDYNPNYVVLPAGWTVLGFGTLDRDGSNAKTLEYIATFPAALADGTETMTLSYEDQPGWFSGLTALDDDEATDGINIVVDYNSTFDLANTVEAKWRNMFDENGKIVNEIEMLDYSVVISSDGVDLETIDFTWDGSAYTPSAAQTAIDPSVFGSGFEATYMVTTPEGDEYEMMVDIVVGVFPPKFMGVEDRYVNEDEYVDLLEGITADDGYGNDKTASIEVMFPAGFNMYNPKPGSYQIDLEFTHHVHFDGVESGVMVRDDLALPWDGQYNRPEALNTVGGAIMVFTDAEVFKNMGSGWGSVMVLVGADGKVDNIFDRYTWDFTDETGTTVTDGNVFADWQANIVIEDGGFVIAAHGSTYGTNFRDENLSYDDMITLTDLEPDFDYDIVTTSSYMLTVDDKTAPTALVVNEELMIPAGMYTDVDDVILGNVVAFDNYDMDPAIYVSANGGLDLAATGEYTVEVTVEDMAGNTSMVSFDITVVANEDANLQALIDALEAEFDGLDTLTPAEIQALIDAVQATADAAQTAADDAQDDADAAQSAVDGLDVYTKAEVDGEIDGAIDDFIAESGCGSELQFRGITTIIVSAIAVLGAGALFLIRKP